MGHLKGIAGALACAAALLVIPGCRSTPMRVIHTVREGETVYRIARYYEVRPDSVIRANRVRDVTNVAVGQRLWIPHARRPSAPQPIPLDVSWRGRVSHEISGDVSAQPETDLSFAWPLRGRISSGFGHRRGRKHDGIDIPARRGTRIRAAEAGRVVYVGDVGDYGRVVILKHSGVFKTVYAHNRANRVRKGTFVEKGDVIAEVGASGNARGAHLHFEVRRGARAQDPLLFLR